MDFTRLILDQPGALHRIGMGHCGSVWAIRQDDSLTDNTIPVNTSDHGKVQINKTTFAIKREDCGPGRSVEKEFTMHHAIMAAQETHGRPVVFVPRNHGFLAAADARWPDLLERLPEGFEPCNAIVNERIPALGVTARQELVRRFCPATRSLQEKVLEDVNNNDCLARVYLGSRRQPRPKDGPPLRFFKLRDIPLHIDQFSELGIDPLPYAKVMAEGLAYLWFAAKVDANDVEFVLASPPASFQSVNNNSSTRSDGVSHAVFESEALGRHAMWMLDFDCCNTLPMDNKGVEAAARSFWRNDPYFPRPPEACQSDNARSTIEDSAWEEFKMSFLAAGARLLGDQSELQHLPGEIIDLITVTRGVYDDVVYRR